MDPDSFKRFHRTHISRDDFDDVLRFIGAARLHDMATEEYEALLIAAIIMYARPFSPNELGKHPPADSRLATDLVPFEGAQRALHDQIIQARNKAVAHAESVNNPLQPVTTNTSTAGFATVGRRWHVVNLQLDLDAFEAIAQEMRQLCLNQQLDLAGFRSSDNHE